MCPGRGILSPRWDRIADPASMPAFSQVVVIMILERFAATARQWHPPCNEPLVRDIGDPARIKEADMRTRSSLIMLLIVALAASAVAQRPARRAVMAGWRHSPYQLVLEGAAALPSGDLGDDFVGTEKGLGAGTGYEIGGRLRYYVGPRTAVGPAIHYADFGDWDDILVDEYGEAAYSVGTEIWRFGLDLQHFLAPRASRVRPYLTVGAALTHNRYEDWIEGEGVFATSSSNLAFGAGGGVAFGPMEVSVHWTYNPVENRELLLGSDATDDTYDWSYLTVRAGLAFGR